MKKGKGAVIFMGFVLGVVAMKYVAIAMNTIAVVLMKIYLFVTNSLTKFVAFGLVLMCLYLLLSSAVDVVKQEKNERIADKTE